MTRFRATLFIIFCSFSLSANTGGGVLLEVVFDVNESIRCEEDKSAEGPEDFSTPSFKLNATENILARKMLINDSGWEEGQIELLVSCRWEDKTYRCQWGSRYYLELYPEHAQEQIAPRGQLNQAVVRGLWSEGKINKPPIKILCRYPLGR